LLFPIRLDDAVMGIKHGLACPHQEHPPHRRFSHWKNHDAYQKSFARLLRDLKAPEAKGNERYYTGLVPRNEERFEGVLHGRGWNTRCRTARTVVRKMIKSIPGPTREIVIEARNATSAQKALDLIRTAHQLLEGAPDTFGYHFRVIPRIRTNANGFIRPDS